MFRVIKLNGTWVIVNSSGTHIFAVIDKKDVADRSTKDQSEFISLIDNIQYDGEKASFKYPPVSFDTEVAGEAFIEKHFGPLFEGLEF